MSPSRQHRDAAGETLGLLLQTGLLIISQVT